MFIFFFLYLVQYTSFIRKPFEVCAQPLSELKLELKLVHAFIYTKIYAHTYYTYDVKKKKEKEKFYRKLEKVISRIPNKLF